jgi:hypothetical protein
MNIFKKAIVRFQFRMAKKLMESIMKAQAGNRGISRAERRQFWRDFAKSPEARKDMIKNMESRMKGI